MNKLTEDFLRTFSLSQVALLHTLAVEMETYGLAASDVVELCAERLESYRKQQEEKPADKPAKPPATIPKKRRNHRLSNVRCPVCQSFCEITPVNVSKCTNIGGSWKSSLMCSNKDCRFTQLSEKSTLQLRDENVNNA